MSIELVDFSWARPGGKAIKAAGKKGVLRYVDYPGANGKGLTKAEVADYFEHDLDIGLVFESSPGRALDGANAGSADGQLVAAFLKKLKVPTDVAVHFAVDRDVSVEQLPVIDAYLRAAGAVIGAARTGVYGERLVIDHCLHTGSARWGWQTYAWSHGKVSDRAHVLQYNNGEKINGGAVDLDRALKPDWGQWRSPANSNGHGGQPIDKPDDQHGDKVATWYTVKHGDTLSAIATAHQLTLQALLAFPGNAKYRANPNLIHPGDQVQVGWSAG